MIQPLMQIYLAAMAWSEDDRRTNLAVAQTLEQAGFPVYLHERDGYNRFTVPWKTLPLDEYERAAFEQDRAALLASDVFVLLIGSKTLEEALCVKLGMAHAQKMLQQPLKYLVGLLTVPATGYRADMGPSVRLALDQIIETPESLIAYLGRYGRQRNG